MPDTPTSKCHARCYATTKRIEIEYEQMSSKQIKQQLGQSRTWTNDKRVKESSAVSNSHKGLVDSAAISQHLRSSPYEIVRRRIRVALAVKTVRSGVRVGGNAHTCTSHTRTLISRI
eukprot:2601638-Pleurochrysis_carterae.AAC.2